LVALIAVATWTQVMPAPDRVGTLAAAAAEDDTLTRTKSLALGEIDAVVADTPDPPPAVTLKPESAAVALPSWTVPAGGPNRATPFIANVA
jgi:hypothetical protein